MEFSGGEGGGKIDAGVFDNIQSLDNSSGVIFCCSSILRSSVNYLNAAYRPFLIYFCVWVSVCRGAFNQYCMYSLVFKEWETRWVHDTYRTLIT